MRPSAPARSWYGRLAPAAALPPELENLQRCRGRTPSASPPGASKPALRPQAAADDPRTSGIQILVRRRIVLSASAGKVCASPGAASMAGPVKTFRLFVSSPGDVERQRVERVASRLNGDSAGEARLELEPDFCGRPSLPPISIRNNRSRRAAERHLVERQSGADSRMRSCSATTVGRRASCSRARATRRRWAARLLRRARIIGVLVYVTAPALRAVAVVGMGVLGAPPRLRVRGCLRSSAAIYGSIAHLRSASRHPSSPK